MKNNHSKRFSAIFIVGVMVLYTLIFLVMAIPDFSTYTRQEWFTTDDNDQGGIGGARMRGQSFTLGTVGPNNDFVVGGISVKGKLDVDNTTSDWVTFFVYSINASGHPTSRIGEGAIAISEIDNSTFSWFNVSFTDYGTLSAPTKYALVANTTLAGVNDFLWRYNSTDDYAGGEQLWNHDSGAGSIGDEWTNATSDYMFEIYNGTSEAITVSLDSPPSDNFTVNSLIFTSSYISVGGISNITQATYSLWFTNHTLYNSTSLYVNDTNSTSLNVSLILGDYLWNVEACGTNATGTPCSSSVVNKSFSIVKFKEESEFYNANTGVGVSETIQLNVSLYPSLTISTAILRYNNTDFTGSIISNGGNNYTLHVNYT